MKKLLYCSLIQHHAAKKWSAAAAPGIWTPDLHFVGVFCLSVCFYLCCAACGILVPYPGIEPSAPSLEAQSPNHRTTREVPAHTVNHSLLIPPLLFNTWNSIRYTHALNKWWPPSDPKPWLPPTQWRRKR